MGAGEFRSSVSRAYYAVYSRVTAALPAPFERPKGWEGPRHAHLESLISKHFIRLGEPQRKKLIRLVAWLYKMRILADYLPSVKVSKEQSLFAIGLMNKILAIIKEKY
jgi:uncharacterized protein (UPF0332 family)